MKMKSSHQSNRCTSTNTVGTFDLLFITFLSISLVHIILNRNDAEISAVVSALLTTTTVKRFVRQNSAWASSHSWRTSASRSAQSFLSRTSRINSSSSSNEQIIEAVQSMVDFHEGTWMGETIQSFTVNEDVAAGIIDRRSSDKDISYKATVQIGADPSRKDYQLTETIECMNSNDVHHPTTKRTVLFGRSNMDVDSVDSSYSLDMTLPQIPSFFAGTEKLLQYGIEHCIATSDSTRSRCFAFYGGTIQQLIRIVVCHERRCTDNNDSNAEIFGTSINEQKAATTKNVKEKILQDMQPDIDRLIDKIIGNIQQVPETTNGVTNGATNVGNQGSILDQYLTNGNNNDSNSMKDNNSNIKPIEVNAQFTAHTTSLLEICSGVWKGDSVVRDIPTVPTIVERSNDIAFEKRAKQTSSSQSTSTSSNSFGSWNVGVQKCAWRYKWFLGEEIQSIHEYGRSMGSSIFIATDNPVVVAGTVCVNEGLSRRIPVQDRMVYIDWDGDTVGFLIGSALIQVPRQLRFDRTRQLSRPLFTEFAIIQQQQQQLKQDDDQIVLSDDPNEDNSLNIELKKLVCSKISRVYNHEGRFKQGITSFYNFKRFGEDEEQQQ